MVDYLTVATIGRPHGLKGEVEIKIETDFPDRFKSKETLLLVPPLGGRRSLTISSSRAKNEKLVVKFEGIDDQSAAEVLTGRRLVITADEAAKLPADTYWHHELIGLVVVTTEGRRLGQVAEILRTAAHDIYVVRNDREYLIPATKEIIKSVNRATGEMVVAPPAGLLE